MTNTLPEYQSIIDFWFQEIEPPAWWKKDPDFDQLLQERFGKVHAMATAGELSGWRETALGRLAEIIVLDQFSRNIFRDTQQAFACDGIALVLAQEAVSSGADNELTPGQRAFLYMPYMHSESPCIHKKAVDLFGAEGMSSGNLEFEMKHKAIIDRFGRYPHRNELFGRVSTDEEVAFLEGPGSSF